MFRTKWVAGTLGLGLLSIAAWGMLPTAARGASTSTQPSSEAIVRTLVPWGTGNHQVGIRRAAHESPADGVGAIAVATDGAILLLDRLNERVVRLDPQGRHRGAWSVAEVPADAEELAVAPDGALGVYSPLRARVWVLEGGTVTGTVPVPRGMRELRTIGFGHSHDVIARSAHQETYRLGPPSAPQPLSAILRSKREGEFHRADGAGLACRLDAQRRAELIVLDSASGRTRVARSMRIIDKPVMSARLVGRTGGIACVRLEHPVASSELRVRLSVRCLDAHSGHLVFQRDLGALQGPYVPRRVLAMGGEPARLAYMRPADEGLHVTAWELPRSEYGGAR